MSLPRRWEESVQDQWVKDLNTLLTALYVLIDDQGVKTRVGRGRRPLLSDSELITLAVAQVLQGYHCERRWIRYIRSSSGATCSLTCPTSRATHKWLKDAQPLRSKAILTLASCCPSWFDDLWMTDATAVACGMSHQTAQRSNLAEHAGYGYCVSHSHYCWRLKLYLVWVGDGMPIM